MKGFIRLEKADRHSLWLRAQDILGVSELPKGCTVYVRGQAEGFLVQNSSSDVLDRLEQAEKSSSPG